MDKLLKKGLMLLSTYFEDGKESHCFQVLKCSDALYVYLEIAYVQKIL